MFNYKFIITLQKMNLFKWRKYKIVNFMGKIIKLVTKNSSSYSESALGYADSFKFGIFSTQKQYIS